MFGRFRKLLEVKTVTLYFFTSGEGLANPLDGPPDYLYTHQTLDIGTLPTPFYNDSRVFSGRPEEGRGSTFRPPPFLLSEYPVSCRLLVPTRDECPLLLDDEN